MNYKNIGEIGQAIAIGELGKLGIKVAVPLSDNLPFDLVAIIDTRLLKLQIKSSSSLTREGAISFRISTTNFYKGTRKRYNTNEIDLLIGVDLLDNHLYVFGPEIFTTSETISIRKTPPKNGQSVNIKMASDYILNKDTCSKFFGIHPPELTGPLIRSQRRLQYSHTCPQCHRTFSNGNKYANFCSLSCSAKAQARVIRPEKNVLAEEIYKISWKALGRKYGVSDNAVRKWARSYELI